MLGTTLNIRKLSKSLWLSIPNREGMLPGNSAPYCTDLIFRALFVCGFWSFWKKEAQPLKIRTQKPGAAKASSGISFLYMSFMYRPAHHEPPLAAGERRNSACLMLHLLVIHEGSSAAVLFKCHVVGAKVIILFPPKATAGFWLLALSFFFIYKY